MTPGRRTCHEKGSAPVQRALSRVASLALSPDLFDRRPANLLVDCLVLTLALMGLKHKNKRAMKECELLTQREKHVVALTMAIVTAPWLFFIPLYWY